MIVHANVHGLAPTRVGHARAVDVDVDEYET
jgi:hypothetical protein